ncbi:hypothetical protein GCM10009422_05920 [Brevundimonas kwangchunensis]|uniref:Uncharacterized protein n=1 Tax=Brevundimonas kwangchunensis TaxID=322163 RepID=A0ABN1GL22_9CAUL
MVVGKPVAKACTSALSSTRERDDESMGLRGSDTTEDCPLSAPIRKRPGATVGEQLFLDQSGARFRRMAALSFFSGLATGQTS